jgi:poly(beta-D-mannuronate) C5 epimerase
VRDRRAGRDAFAPGRAAALALALLLPLPAAALDPDQPSLDPGRRLQDLAAAAMVDPDRSAADLIAGARLADVPGLPASAIAVPAWSPLPPGPADLRLQTMRLFLTALAQGYGADDMAVVLGAQPTLDARALVVRSGTATLADLRNALPPAPAGALVLTMPLVVMPGAALRLVPGEALHMSRPEGAFLINFGLLQIDGAEIAGIGARNPRRGLFAPFVATADGGTLQARGARVHALGFGKTIKFSGFSVLQGTIRPPRQPSWIAGSSFSHMRSVVVGLANGVTVTGNRFRDMTGPALLIHRSQRVTVSANLFSGGMETNAIVIEEGSADAAVSGNMVLGGKRNGIVVRNDSTGARVTGNVVWRRLGGGIAVLRSDCGLVSGNLVMRNGQKGIEVRTSHGVTVEANAVYANHSAGVWVSAQPAGATTVIRGNRLAENGAGMAAAAGERLVLEGNDFRYQFPQFVSGDLAALSNDIARNLRGTAPLVLGAASAPPADIPCAN